MNDFYSIDESDPKYSLDRLIPESDEWVGLFQKLLTQYKTRANFWKGKIDLGKKCVRFERRDILTPEQRARYIAVEDKIPIEPQEIKPVIATLERLIRNAVPGTDIAFEDETPPPNAASPDVMKFVISKFKHRLGIPSKRSKALHKGLITGYPICTWADKQRDAQFIPGGIPLKISVRPWDSVLPPLYYESETGDDIDDVIFIKMMDRNQLLETFPARKEAFATWEKEKNGDPFVMDRLTMMNNSETYKDRANFIYDMVTQAKFDAKGGRYFTIQHVFPITRKYMAWVNPATQDVVIPPPDWPQKRINEWSAAHPEFELLNNVPVKTLWVTTVSSDGFIWENRISWYQMDGKLPAAWFIADTVDNMPTSVTEDMLPYVLMSSVCETEGLSQVRKGAGTTTFVQEGSVINVEDLGAELAAENGVVIITKTVPITEAVQTKDRKPNTTFLELSDRTINRLQNVHRINDVAMGATANRQSSQAKRTQIEQTLAPQSRYVESYHSYLLQLENLLCSLIPLVVTEETVIEMKDEFGADPRQEVVNQTEYDYAGQAKIVANDILTCRYRAEPTIGDDSRTSRENQLIEFTEIMEATGNQLFKLDPTMLGAFLKIFPNKFAREAAKYILENGQALKQQEAQAAQMEAQADMDKIDKRHKVEIAKLKTPKVAFRFDPKAIEEAPEGAKLMYEIMSAYEQKNAAADVELPTSQAQTEETGEGVDEQVTEEEGAGNEEMAQ